LALGSLVVGISFVSCGTTISHHLDRNAVTNVMIAQIGAMDFYTPRPGDEIRRIFIARSGSPMGDISNHQAGAWIEEHHGRIVSVEAYVQIEQGRDFWGPFIRRFDKWRVEYAVAR